MKTYEQMISNLQESTSPDDEKRILKCLEDTKNNISQLCDLVNSYSGKLGLGRKVRLEDFNDRVLEAIKILKK